VTAEAWERLVRDIRTGKARILARGRAQELTRITVKLDGGPRDGAAYDCPAVYPGGDGLPDAIAITVSGVPALYIRSLDTRTYRYSPRGSHGTRHDA
jgi:hypothetical protein